MQEKVTNETLAFMLNSQEKRGDERHDDNVKRLDEIREQVLATNGRLQKVEKRQAVDLKRFEHIDGQFERIDVALARRGEHARAPRREVVVRVGWASAGAAAIPIIEAIWKAMHG